jgi:hypothetical protein
VERIVGVRERETHVGTHEARIRILVLLVGGIIPKGRSLREQIQKEQLKKPRARLLGRVIESKRSKDKFS